MKDWNTAWKKVPLFSKVLKCYFLNFRNENQKSDVDTGEVNFRSLQAWTSTLTLKPRIYVSRSPKHIYQRPYKSTYVHQKLEKNFDSGELY